MRQPARHPVRQPRRDLSLYEVDDFEQAAARVRDDIDLAFITHGPQGSVVVAGGDRYEVPAIPVERLVDTTGAGDLYAAGVLYGLTNGHDLATWGRLGSAGPPPRSSATRCPSRGVARGAGQGDRPASGVPRPSTEPRFYVHFLGTDVRTGRDECPRVLADRARPAGTYSSGRGAGGPCGVTGVEVGHLLERQRGA